MFLVFCGVVLSDNLITSSTGIQSYWADVTHLLDVAQTPSTAPPNDCGVGCGGSPIPAGSSLIDTSDNGNYLIFSSRDPNVIAGEQSIPSVNNLYWMDISKGPEQAVTRLVTHFAGSTTASAGYFGISNGLLPPTFEPATADLSGDGMTVVFDSRINANAYDASVPIKNDMPSVERDLSGHPTIDNATSDVFVWHASAIDPANNIAVVDLLNTAGKSVATSLKATLNALYSSDPVPAPDPSQAMPIGVFVTTPRLLSIRDLIASEFASPLTNFLQIVTEAASNHGLSGDGATVLYQSDLPAQWIDRKNPGILDDALPVTLNATTYFLLEMSLDGFVVKGASNPSAKLVEQSGLTQTVTVDVNGNAQGYFNYSAWLAALIKSFPIIPPAFFEAEFLQLSSDGNRVAFSTIQTGSGLVQGVQDADFSQDVFVFDIKQNKNILVSRNLDNHLIAAGNTQQPINSFIQAWILGQPYAYELMDSANLSMNQDGSVIAIQSSAANLITGFTNNNVVELPAALTWNTSTDAFFKFFGPLDLYTVSLTSPDSSTTTLINTPDGKTNTNLTATLYGLSSDGSTAYFETAANNFYVPAFNDPHYNPTFATGLLPPNFLLGGFNNLWQRGIKPGTINLVTTSYNNINLGANKGSVASPTLPGSRDLLSTVSETGRFVLFDNPSNNLADGINDPSFKGGTYLRDTQTKLSTLMSTKATGNVPSLGLFLQTSLASINDASGILRVFMGGSNGEDMQTQYASDQIDNGLTPHFYSEDYPKLVVASSGENPALISVAGENFNNSIIDFKRGALTIKASPTPSFPTHKGGAHVAMGDINGDGVVDYVYGSPTLLEPQVIVIDGQTGAELINLKLAETTHKDGVFVAAGDVDQDGYADIAISYGNGTNADAIEVYSGRRGFNLLAFKLSEAGAGKSPIAIGNVQGNAVPELIVSNGGAGVNHIRVYSLIKNPQWVQNDNDYSISPLIEKLASSITPTEAGMTHGGLYVATGEMNANGYDEIVAGSAIAPTVAIYTGGGHGSEGQNYVLWTTYSLKDIPGNSAYAHGTHVAARPGQVIVGAGKGGSEVRIYSSSLLKTPVPGVSPILQKFTPSNINRFGKPNPVRGIQVG